jgi:hypothetical protein
LRGLVYVVASKTYHKLMHSGFLTEETILSKISKGEWFDKIIRVKSVENNKVSLRMQYMGGKIHECPTYVRSKGSSMNSFEKHIE